METPIIQVARRGSEAKWQSGDKKTTLSAHYETRGAHGTPPQGRIRLIVLVLAGEVRSGHTKVDSDLRVEINAELAVAIGEAISAINGLANASDRSLDESIDYSSHVTCPQGHVLYFGVRVMAGTQADVPEAFLGIRAAGGEIKIRFADPADLSRVRSFIQRAMAG